MNKILYFVIVSTILVFGCNPNLTDNEIEQWKNEIIDTEKAFAEMVEKEGIPKAFLFFAADEVVLMRNNKLIIGRKAMEGKFTDSEINYEETSLVWKPDFVDVSASGDLGYTYGKFVYTTPDSLGILKDIDGVFHTIWKRQPNGNWRFVYD